jgi:predicted DNA-binding transcriptional regulator AlpA
VGDTPPKPEETSNQPSSVSDLLARLEALAVRLETASPRPLTVDRAALANLLSCSERQISRLVSAGEMPPPLKFGTQKTVCVLATIEQWLNAGCPDLKPFERLRGATARR